jgi:ATP-binding cassette, subfamily B, bacterial HlyB/CyaB
LLFGNHFRSHWQAERARVGDVNEFSEDLTDASQSDSCLAALATVARHHGVHLSLEKIRRDHALDGASLPSAFLVRLAEESGLKARRVSLKWRDLAKLGSAVPAILRMSNGAAMVLVGFQADGPVPMALLRDPLEQGEAVVGVDEVRLTAAWSGELILIRRRFTLADGERPFGLMSLVAEVLKERRIFRDVGVAALALSLFSLAPPLLYMIIVDRILVYQRMASLWVLGLGVLFILSFDTLFGFLKRYLLAIGTARIDARLCLYIFDRMIGLPMDFFERTPTGQVTYKLNEIWRIRNFLTGQLFGTGLEASTLVVLIPVLFVLSPTLTFMTLGVGLLMFVTVLLYIRPISRAYRRVVQAEVAKNTLLVESIHGIRTIKSLAIEEPKRQLWDARVAEAVRANTAMQLLANQPQTILQPLEKAIYSGALLVGSYLAIGQGATVYAGTLIAFTMIASRVASPLVQIAGLLQQYEEVRGAISQVASVVNNEPEQPRGFQGARPKIAGHIRFSHVRFRYPGATTYALKDVSFELPKGGMLGIMGRSGSGKTTVTRLLQGLSRDYEGLIKVDGIDLREIDLYHLRSRIGVVLQDNFLFQGTIRDNIMAGHRGASLEEVIRAARLAGAEEFIERLPKGYETELAEGSSNLSGGQKQRIAIARALLGDPAILILDEATSALDPESESIVNSNLRRIAEGRSMIVISHRLASLVHCDQILVLEQGELNDAGAHAELLGRCEIYRHLWTQQNRHVISGPTHDGPALATSSSF